MIKALHVGAEWSMVGLLDQIAEGAQLPGKQASRPSVVRFLMDHHWGLNGRWVCPVLRWKTREDPFTRDFILRLDEGYVDELKHVRGLSAGGVIEHLLLARCEPRVDEDGITRLTYMHPDGLVLETNFVPLPHDHWFNKYAHRAAIRDWFRVGRYRGEPDPRLEIIKKERAMDREYQERLDAEARRKAIEAKERARGQQIVSQLVRDEHAYAQPAPRDRLTEMLEREHADYLRSTGTLKKAPLTAQERFKADWDYVNAGDEESEPCNACGQPFEAGSDGKCSSCGDWGGRDKTNPKRVAPAYGTVALLREVA